MDCGARREEGVFYIERTHPRQRHPALDDFWDVRDQPSKKKAAENTSIISSVYS